MYSLMPLPAVQLEHVTVPAIVEGERVTLLDRHGRAKAASRGIVTIDSWQPAGPPHSSVRKDGGGNRRADPVCLLRVANMA
jgi:hypothetical protein